MAGWWKAGTGGLDLETPEAEALATVDKGSSKDCCVHGGEVGRQGAGGKWLTLSLPLRAPLSRYEIISILIG